jgi:hypothetical protein
MQGSERLLGGSEDEGAWIRSDEQYGSETEELVCFMAKQLLVQDHEGG